VKRFTTHKLINNTCSDDEAILDSIDTSDSILDQSNKAVPYITDQFVAIQMQTAKHSWLSREAYTTTVLCKITIFDYALISFKKERLNDVIREHNPFTENILF
jgi:hypothetical protein